MSLRAPVKQEPGDVPGRVCIKQEPESTDAEWVHSESEYSPQLQVKDEPAPLEQEGLEHLKEEPMSVQQEMCLPQETAVKGEPLGLLGGVKEEPAWIGGAEPADSPESGLQPEQPLGPGPAPAAACDVKPSVLVRDCWVRLERCAITRGAAERWAATCGDPTYPYVSEEHEREIALKQLSGLLIKIKPSKRKKPYTCDICKKDFNILPNLITHKQIHMKKKCDIKYKKRRERYPLFSVYDRSGEEGGANAGRFPSTRFDPAPAKLSYLCEICKAVFDDLNSLKVHALIHAKLGKIPYACKLCGTKFATIHAFKNHSRFHAELRPYPCKECQKRFTRKCDLNKHMIAHAAAGGPCAACEARRALRLLGGLLRPAGGEGAGAGAGAGDPVPCRACHRDA